MGSGRLYGTAEKQAPLLVVYLSFGSIAGVRPHQIQELVVGIQNSGRALCGSSGPLPDTLTLEKFCLRDSWRKPKEGVWWWSGVSSLKCCLIHLDMYVFKALAAIFISWKQKMFYFSFTGRKE
ncbi:hypothetical protein KI387_000453, partial [Taxus chinensis]